MSSLFDRLAREFPARPFWTATRILVAAVVIGVIVSWVGLILNIFP